MEFYNELNEANNLLASDIKELGRNRLVFNLIIGRVSEIPEDVIISGKNIGPAYKVHFDNGTYEVYFESYICFNVINESYEDLGGDDFEGKRIRLYTKSNFLDYVNNDTFADFEYPGEFKHYSFITSDHIINVVATEEPTIKYIVTKKGI